MSKRAPGSPEDRSDKRWRRQARKAAPRQERLPPDTATTTRHLYDVPWVVVDDIGPSPIEISAINTIVDEITNSLPGGAIDLSDEALIKAYGAFANPCVDIASRATPTLREMYDTVVETMSHVAISSNVDESKSALMEGPMPNAIPYAEQIMDMVNAEIKRREAAGTLENLFTILAPTKTSTLMKDDRWKTHTFAGGEELLFTGLRQGKKADFLFMFEPVDDQPYTRVEFSQKNAFDMLPMFQDFVIKALMPDEADLTDMTWPLAVASMAEALEFKKVHETVTDTGFDYTKNPEYGMF